MIRLTPGQGRALALAILVAAIALVFMALVAPVAHWLGASGERADELEQQITSYQRLAASQDLIKRELDGLRRLAPNQGYYLSGTTQALAAAQMQQHINRVLQQGGAQLVSGQALDQQEPGNAEVRLRVRMRCTLDQLAQISHGLESGSPMLFLDNVVINARTSGRRTQIEQRAFQPVQLDVQFDAIGYVRGETP